MHLLILIVWFAALTNGKPDYKWDKDNLHVLSSHNPESERVRTDWKAQDKRKIEQAVQQTRKLQELDKPAKNVIFMMGDGMGISTLTAARFYLAQSRNLSIENASLSWENMPYAALSKTYSLDRQTPDSAGTATAMMCGEKTYNSIIACNQDVILENCSSVAGTELPSILHHAIEDGRWTGVVSTSRVTHASPACAYAHAAHRDWESDADLPDDAVGVCKDIAAQYIDNELNKQIRVMLGGGTKMFIPWWMTDEDGKNGTRTDDRNLIQEWLDEKESLGLSPSEYAFVSGLDDFDAVDPDAVQYLFGLFQSGHMDHELERQADTDSSGEPSIADMVEKAIKMLSHSSQGYFLFVEGGRIDSGHHSNTAHHALADTVALSDAVQRALDLTSEDDTLIVLTADHSHPFTISGYATIDTDIFQYDPVNQIADDGKPYATLSYANGPGYYYHRTEDDALDSPVPRRNLSEIQDEMKDPDFLNDAGIPRSSDTHAGEDVAIFARGPMAHLFQGTKEQSYIGNAMMYAFCVGDNTDLCDNSTEALPEPLSVAEKGSAPTHAISYFIIALCFVLLKL